MSLCRPAGGGDKGENCDARWSGPFPIRQEATRIARPSDGPKAILLENLEEAFVRKFSISIPNLSMANTSTSSGSEDTMW
jgi:hypothetical protein